MPLTPALREQLRRVPIFASLPDDRLPYLDPGEEYWLEPGAVNTVEGAPATHFFVVLAGEILMTKLVGEGLVARVDTFGPGVFYGELPLLLGTGYPLSGTALTRCHIFRLDRAEFLRLLTICPEVLGGILETMAARVQLLEQFAQGREKLAALGTLAAGLAHELNNPASAAERAARQLRDAARVTEAHGLTLAASLRPEELASLASFRARLPDQPPARAVMPSLGALERAECEGTVADWLDARSVADPWEIAPTLLAAGLDVARLDALTDAMSAASLPAAIGWLASSLETVELAATIEHSAGRIAELVRAIKEYSYLGRAPVQEVDLHDGIENTLTILGHKLRGVTLVREYDHGLPRVSAQGGALNQVWTNLLDNAIDATGGRGHIRVRTAREAGSALVEIADDGPGIPPEIRGRIFEPFFTTKGVGEGSGLGLAISYRIVVREHGGDLQVASSHGGTTFRVWLPLADGRRDG